MNNNNNNNNLVTETTIIAELNNLYCSSSYYNNNGNKHISCEKIIDKITNNIHVFSNYNTLMANFLNGMTKSYYGQCFTTPKCIDCFKKILNLIDVEILPLDIFKKMCNTNQVFTQEVYISICEKKEISKDFLTRILFTQNTKLIYDIFENKSLVLNLHPEHLETLCLNNKAFEIYNGINGQNHGYNQQSNYVEMTQEKSSEFNSKIIMDFINSKIKVSKTTVIMAIMFNIKPLITKQLITLGPELSDEYLVAACYGSNKDMIEFLLDNKIQPNNKCIPALFANEFSKTFIDLDKFNKYTLKKSLPNSIKDTGNIKIFTALTNILLNYDYNLTYEDLLLLTRNFITINGIEKYNIKFDNKFLETCSDVGFYPAYKHNLKADVSCLQKECKKPGNITAIKELVNKQKVKPDEICLENACRYKSNSATIKFLIENGAKVSANSVKNIIYATGNSSSCYVIDEYIKCLDKEKALPKVEQKLIIPKPKLEIVHIDNYEDKDDSVNGENSDNIEVLKVDIKEEVKEEKQVKTKKGIKVTVKKTKDKNPEEVIIVKPKEEKIDYTTIQISITEKDTISLSVKFVEYFSLDKDVKLNMLSFKRILINYLNNKKLIKKDSFNIELPDDLCNAIDFDTKKYGNILDIKLLDKFCLFVLDINLQSNSPKKS